MYTAHSENVGCQEVHPEQNAIVLRNGRRIEYDHLVIAAGMNDATDQVKGLEDAWRDTQHPVFTQKGITHYVKLRSPFLESIRPQIH